MSRQPDEPVTLRPYAAAYWGPRAERIDACADRALQFLEGLSQVDPSLGEWFETSDRRADARSRPVALAREALVELLGSGRNRRDADRSVITELGFSAALWNGKEPSVGLRIGCGKQPRTPNVKNAVVLNLPRLEEAVGLVSPDAARGTMRILVECWEPDWATWTTHEWREEQEAADGEPVFGWMTYLNGAVHPRGLPVGVTLEELGSGTLVVAGEAPGSVTGAGLAGLRDALLSGCREPLGGRAPFVPH